MGEYHISDAHTGDFYDFLAEWYARGMDSANEWCVAEVSTGAIAALHQLLGSPSGCLPFLFLGEYV